VLIHVTLITQPYDVRPNNFTHEEGYLEIVIRPGQSQNWKLCPFVLEHTFTLLNYFGVIVKQNWDESIYRNINTK